MQVSCMASLLSCAARACRLRSCTSASAATTIPTTSAAVASKFCSDIVIPAMLQKDCQFTVRSVAQVTFNFSLLKVSCHAFLQDTFSFNAVLNA
jgi:hypothetical protein